MGQRPWGHMQPPPPRTPRADHFVRAAAALEAALTSLEAALTSMEAAAPRKRYNSAGTIHRRCAQCASSPKDDLTSAIHRLAQAARPGICGGRLTRCRGGATAGHAAEVRLRVRSSFRDSGVREGAAARWLAPRKGLDPGATMPSK